MAAALRSQARLRALDALIRVEGPVHVIDIVRDLWAWCLDDASADQPTITLALPDVLLDPSPEMLLQLTSRIDDAAIQSRSGLDVLLHAAGICTPSGTVCALVGPSGLGRQPPPSPWARTGGVMSPMRRLPSTLLERSEHSPSHSP